MAGLEFAVGVIVFVVGLTAFVALHELGHLIPAKRFGVGVKQYMVGFGPTLFSRRVGETEYGLKLLLLGGYISMEGMYPPKPPETEEYSKTPFFALSAPKRIAIMFGGPFVNLILAVVFFLLAFCVLGAPAVGVGAVSQCTPASLTSECQTGDPRSPAAAAGLREGDIVTRIDGRPVASWGDLSTTIQSSAGENVVLDVSRGEKTVPLEVQIGSISDGAGGEIGFFGMTPSTVLVPQSLGQGFVTIGQTISQNVSAFASLPVSVMNAGRSIFTGEERSAESPLSMVGVGRAAGVISSSEAISPDVKVQTFLTIMGSVNLALFILNMVPLPPFDGGHIAVALWQSLRDFIAKRRGQPTRGPIDVSKLIPVTLTVFAVLVGLTLVMTVADIVNPII
ncbi:hypothetical protein ASE14_09630 [Agromyces sp. Root81]|nr:hypothetical protein ASE14_09630 [Agromyces sp. Root81]